MLLCMFHLCHSQKAQIMCSSKSHRPSTFVLMPKAAHIMKALQVCMHYVLQE